MALIKYAQETQSMRSNAVSAEAPLLKPLPARRSGFTLIEILIAVAVIAILATLSFPIYKNYIDKAKRTVAINTLEISRKSLEEYNMQNGVYPATINTATGLDGLGRTVLDAQLLFDFRKNFFSVDSYTSTSVDYTLTVRANDSAHTLLQMSPNSTITQGP